MNKDDMSDDAEFDAFLNGDGDLARRLQGLAQPGPSAALDAAILANARAAMAQDARPVAANDSGDTAAAPRLAPGFGWRWRMPAGIAAAVLVGVFAKQSFEASSTLNEVALPAPAPVMVVPEERSAAAAAPPPAELQMPVPPPPPPKPAPRAEFKRAAPDVVEAIPAQMKPEPAPVVVHESAAPPSAPAPAPAAVSVQVNGRRSTQPVIADKATKLEYSDLQKSAPTANYSAAAPSAPAPAPAPAPEGYYGGMADAARAPNVAGAVSSKREMAQRKAAATPVGQMTESEWLDRIEKLLAQGRQAEAEADWKAFREVYPNYPVPQATREKLE